MSDAALPTQASAAGGDSTCITVESLRYRWPRAERDTLAIPALHIARGEQVFVQGASGSGKTTLLGLLGGVLLPSAGRVELLGSDLAALKPAARDAFRVAHIGFIFQLFNLLPYLSLRDNVLLPCRFSAQRRARAEQHSGQRGELHEQAHRLLDELGLPRALHDKKVVALSVGQQQRVAAARALIGAPELVIADEPTSALDADSREDFLRLLFAECREHGSTLLFVSHDRQLAGLFGRTLSMDELNAAAAETMA